ncbi:hypothetical protein FH972_023995 [Carpinus fangiana]|uniref:Uncharacterized protein n=1 Tax=Carpinus fangiana TaxID=176857 RepID=A0A5N6KXJ8_9ROSI|nr:hypothetical protein FH972_023995 [Carpinus fangiana]
MAFLFKSKKGDKQSDKHNVALSQAPPRNITSADGFRDVTSVRALGPPPPIGGAQLMTARGGISSPTPGDRALQPRSESEMGSYGPRGTQPRPEPNLSLYPWSQRRLDFSSMGQNPFPRYGAAANSVASKDGDVYLMGGLINGSMVKGDLWVVEAGKGPLNCYPVPTTAEGPGPRVGHASLLVGNAYIVFGGDTKVDELDVLDDTLYLLNTSTKHWSRALPAGPRPSGRYGHTLNILGSRIYVFGGQVEGYFFNDLVSFDLNALQQPNNRWEILIQNSSDGGPPTGQVPPARTNHTVITHQERLLLFGGTDGNTWFNDVWVYEPERNSWYLQECIGYIPAAREGHAAALVGDTMYIFGGRTEEGKDLGDLAAFRIPTRRWYTFQNMGPSPSPRSGHGMTTVGTNIVVLAGEPSSAPRDAGELSLAYILDTNKIRYPADAPPVNGPLRSGNRRPSGESGRTTPQERSTSRDGAAEDGSNAVGRYRAGSQESLATAAQRGMDSSNGPLAHAGLTRPRGGTAPSQPGPPPQQQAPQPRANGVRPSAESARINGKTERQLITERASLDQIGQASRADGARDPALQPVRGQQQQYTSAQRQQNFNPFPQTAPVSAPPPPSGLSPFPPAAAPVATKNSPPNNSTLEQSGVASTLRRNQETPDGTREVFATPTEDRNDLHIPGQFPVDSGVGSSPAVAQRNDDLTKELESLRTRNAWYASELALARKAGYTPGTNESSPVNERGSSSFNEEERPLLEALLKMRNELATVQQAFSEHSSQAAQRIAEIEKERDSAVHEAVFARTRSAAKSRGGGSPSESRDLGLSEHERSNDASRRLASALAAHKELDSRLQNLQLEINSEREARALAEASANAAHTRASELDSHKQQNSSELESLRRELHTAQKTAREEAANCSEALASAKMLQVDRDEMHRKHKSAQDKSSNHVGILASLREAMQASTEKSELLERKLESERSSRGMLEEKLAQLRTEHDTRVSELESTTKKLQDAEEMAANHKTEAEKHRNVVLAGFGKSVSRDDEEEFAANDERVSILQQRLEAANALVRQNQAAADAASEKLRSAEERIAGLEAYQEQTSREGLGMRKQLQMSSQNTLSLHAEKADLQQRLAQHVTDLTALQAQHGAVKNLLHERGVDTSNLSAYTGSPTSGPPSERLRELETQLEASKAAHEVMRTSFEQREQEANRGWENKIGALDSDYQAAVKYLKGTEKMLGKLKLELAKYKSANKELEEKVSRSTPTLGWEDERSQLRRELEDAQQRIRRSSDEVERQLAAVRAVSAERERLEARLETTSDSHRSELEIIRRQNAELEARATEAERKAHDLLTHVGTTVNNYRRESQLNGVNGRLHSRNTSTADSTISATSGYSIETPQPLKHTDNREMTDSSTTYTTSAGRPSADSDVLSRNSMALDSLASELETLRSHWETTNKNYSRRSDASVVNELEKTPTQTSHTSQGPAGQQPGGLSGSLATWRKKLDMNEAGGDSGRSSYGDAGLGAR